MQPPPFPILFEDNHLLVINKPAGVATMGATASAPAVHRDACLYLKRKYEKPGRVYLGVVSRLDTVTSGVLVFARTSKAAARLSAQFRERRVAKTYLATLEGRVAADSGELAHHLAKFDAERRMRAVAPEHPGAQEARLRFRVRERRRDASLLEIELLTGRKHQIRAQWEAEGHPVWGDRKYGARTSFGSGIALHAARLALEHPTRKEEMVFTAPTPREWRVFGWREHAE